MYASITSKLLVLLLLFGLVGCDSNPKIKMTHFDTAPEIFIVFTEDFTDIRNKYDNQLIVGLTEWKDGVCYIYVPPLKDVYDSISMCVIGHEIMHCVLGYFHNEDEGNSCY